MSKLVSLAKSSIGLTYQQCGGFQGGFLVLSSKTTGSNSNASRSNAQQASVKLANERNENDPVAVAEAKAIVELHRPILSSKPYYFKIDNDFKTYSNITVQSNKDANKSTDYGMFLAKGRDTFKTGILAVQGCIAGNEIQDLIVDTGSPVSVVSSQFYETIIDKTQLQPIKGHYIAVNGSLLNIKGVVELRIVFDKIE